MTKHQRMSEFYEAAIERLRVRVADLATLRQERDRLAQQARDISLWLSEAGIGPCTIPEGVKQLLQERDQWKADAARYSSSASDQLLRAEKAEQERDQWQTEHTRLREALEAVRDLLVGCQQIVGYIPGQGYSTTMTEHERLIASGIAHINHILAESAALTPPAATPQEPERCVFTMRTVRDGERDDVRQWASSCGKTWTPVENVFDPRARSHCPSCERPLTVAAPQEENHADLP